MDRPRIYVETTIPSAYFDERSAPAMVERREVTRRWWATARAKYDLRTSLAVREELERGPLHRTTEWVRLIENLPVLPITSGIGVIVSEYQSHRLLPVDDALHLALASFYRCDYLLTWDFNHLANENKFVHIQRVNARQGLFVPRIVAPSTLMGQEP
ncbi:MAG TPA: PIN domain-containing protein [Longimicrobium sp.]|jgi:predicted nucleic acid-binding protein|nr:PIN domain-containing protein [Longimicrobium sp.]